MQTVKTAAMAAFLLLATTAHAVGPKAVPCLSAADPKGCLANVAAASLAAEKSPESRADGYASLLTSLAKAGVRRDDIFSAAVDDGTAPVFSRWLLALARRTYALHFEIVDAAVESPQRIEVLADLLRARRDGWEKLMVVWAICEAREGEPPSALVGWNGILDRLCRLDDLDVVALESELPGLSAMFRPVVDAYNRDNEALGRSIAASLSVLAEYEWVLGQKMPAKDRDDIRLIIAIGHLCNATALTITGRGSGAKKALGISLGHMAKAPSHRKDPGYLMTQVLASWIYAKAGMRDEAIKSVRESLGRADGPHGGSVGDRVSAVATAIETLRVLESSNR